MAGFGKLRVFLRRKTRVPIKVTAVSSLSSTKRDTESVPFHAQDIGVGGIGLETLVVLDLGDMLELELTLPSGKPISARAIVKNLRPEKRGPHMVYQAGLEFLQISEEDQKAISEFVGSGDFMI